MGVVWAAEHAVTGDAVALKLIRAEAESPEAHRRVLREARGLRQKDVSDLSERQVRRIEQGVSRLTEPSARAFADAFGVTLGEFLDEVARRASALAKDSAA